MIPRALANVLAWVWDLIVLTLCRHKPLKLNWVSWALARFFCFREMYKVFEQAINNSRKGGSLNINSKTAKKVLTAFFIPAQYIHVNGIKWTINGKIQAAEIKTKCRLFALYTAYFSGLNMAIKRSTVSEHKLVMDKLRNNHCMAFVIHLLHSEAEMQALDGNWTKPTQKSARASESRNQLIVLWRRFLEMIRYITKPFPRTVVIDKIPPTAQNQTPGFILILKCDGFKVVNMESEPL